ncbi:hypothetical protein [Vitreoscilla filiformis]|jgi:hypothetical protein|uniref:hypothetical protein n=1 Tax=Vitreoscilla filiformis TaxID=63 RepID=UPI000B79CA24|nr:hypothetical protein [Vitreoscilla filiformis]
MKTSSFVRGGAALLLALSAMAASAQTYTKQQLQELYSSFVTGEGFRPEITPAGNVKFKREGRTHVIYVDEKDPTYFRMVFAFAESDKSQATRVRRLEAASFATGEVKVGKAYLDPEGDPVFSAEIFTVVPGDAKAMMPRILQIMDLTYEKYQTKFNGSR